MRNLIRLELKQNNLTPYHIASAIITVVMLGFVYLIAFIPVIEPGDADAELFHSLYFVIGLAMVVTMGIFSILSATMAAKIVVSEYDGKKAMLLFSYPVPREKVFFSKIIIVFGYTVIAMICCEFIILTIFFASDIVFSFSREYPDFKLALHCVADTIICALIAGFCGMLSLWIGFMKKSVIATIVASCVIITVMCQIAAVMIFSTASLHIMTLIVGTTALIGYWNMRRRIKKMEI